MKSEQQRLSSGWTLFCGCLCLQLLLLLAVNTKGDSPQDTVYEFVLEFTLVNSYPSFHGSSSSMSLTTTLTPQTVEFQVQPTGDPNLVAVWESKVVQSGPNNTWQEEGFINFPDNSSVLTFMSPGLNGIQLASEFVDATYGTVQYNVTGGLGLFEGAYGVMVDFFFDLSRNQSSTVVVNAWAKFAVPNGNSKLERHPDAKKVTALMKRVQPTP
eukprot:TRINITY_DN11127_c0_g1_i1.p1 TRINITY_DN11127_c0_g1~~TRINITY_DN11127_c0_g1_i1.p1  ORF type:complete len:213 (+),score=58.95 TRINITY_DN11127_c0_g1_i1:71-709(+)